MEQPKFVQFCDSAWYNYVKDQPIAIFQCAHVIAEIHHTVISGFLVPVHTLYTAITHVLKVLKLQNSNGKY